MRIWIDQAQELQALYCVGESLEPQCAAQYRAGALYPIAIAINRAVAVWEALQRKSRKEIQVLHRRHQITATRNLHDLDVSFKNCNKIIIIISNK